MNFGTVVTRGRRARSGQPSGQPFESGSGVPKIHGVRVLVLSLLGHWYAIHKDQPRRIQAARMRSPQSPSSTCGADGNDR